MKNIIAGIALFMSLGAQASADQIRASDPEGMYQFLLKENIAATLGKDDYDDPNIRVRYYDTNFSIYFYGCENGKDCASIQFFSGYRTDGSWSIEEANSWNEKRRYVRAYVTDSGASRLEYDIFTGEDGMSQADFSDVFSKWTRALGEFEETIGW